VDPVVSSVKEGDESSDDQFENTAEEILEAERGVTHTWTDESEACVTDQEEGRSQVKRGQQRSAEEKAKEEEGAVKEEEVTRDEADGERRLSQASEVDGSGIVNIVYKSTIFMFIEIQTYGVNFYM
jgi:hypothetical protein